jgi:hypothetical protein
LTAGSRRDSGATLGAAWFVHTFRRDVARHRFGLRGSALDEIWDDRTERDVRGLVATLFVAAAPLPAPGAEALSIVAYALSVLGALACLA